VQFRFDEEGSECISDGYDDVSSKAHGRNSC
jgi:hypothetical protein